MSFTLVQCLGVPGMDDQISLKKNMGRKGTQATSTVYVRCTSYAVDGYDKSCHLTYDFCFIVILSKAA